MSNNNIYNEKYRRNFLKNADFKSLNAYLNNMEKLSKKKGGEYLDMYNKDIEFLLLLNDKQQDEANILNIFGGNNNKIEYNNLTLTEHTVCNTEGYINKLNNITQNASKYLDVMMTEADPGTKDILKELENIKNTLIEETFYAKSDQKWMDAIKRYINILLNANKYFSEEEYDIIRSTYFKEIPKFVISNRKFVKESFLYLTKIINSNPNKISKDYVKEFSELRLSKDKLSGDEYNQKKEEMTVKFINEGGFALTMTSKFVERLIDSYKKQQSK